MARQREFLSLNGRKYTTTFPIVSRKHFQVGEPYIKAHARNILIIIEYLWDNEEKSDPSILRFGFSNRKTHVVNNYDVYSYVSRNRIAFETKSVTSGKFVGPVAGIISWRLIVPITRILTKTVSLNQRAGMIFGICSDSCATNGS